MACIALAATIPWGWTAFFVPGWISLVSLLMLLPVCAALELYLVPPPQLPRRESDDENVSDDQIIKMRRQQAGTMHQTITGLQGMLTRWSSASQHTHSDLKKVHDGVHEVMVQTEAAVVNIGNSFRAITEKTALQVKYAMHLLKSANDPHAEDGALAAWLALPDYIRAYEEQLNLVTGHMMQFSVAAEEINKRQGKMREDTIRVDELLDELRAMAKRVGTLALDSSVLASGGAMNQGGIVELTDKIRNTSQDAHELTRRIRQSLEEIKDEMSATYKALRAASDGARHATNQVKVDVAQLNVTMMEKTKEVEETFTRIGALGKEIQDDISKIIIAMQFQDITQQRLERLKQPVLTEVIQVLRTVAEETRRAKDTVNQVIGGAAGGAATPFMVVRSGQSDDAPDGKKDSAATPSEHAGDKPIAVEKPKPSGPAEGGDNVELF
jgi:ABC-type transporter Mla subunit MlaD